MRRRRRSIAASVQRRHEQGQQGERGHVRGGRAGSTPDRGRVPTGRLTRGGQVRLPGEEVCVGEGVIWSRTGGLREIEKSGKEPDFNSETNAQGSKKVGHSLSVLNASCPHHILGSHGTGTGEQIGRL